MKHTILMAIAGGLVVQSISPQQDKKNDLFYKADMRAQKRICINVKNTKSAKTRICRYLV